MAKFSWYYNRSLEWLPTVGLLCLLVGPILSAYTPALMTLGLVLLGINGVIHNPIFSFRALLHDKRYLFFSLFFIITVLSGFWTGFGSSYSKYVLLKLPLLLVPLGIVAFQKVGKHFHIILSISILAYILIGLLTLGNYALHFKEINEAISHAKPIPIALGMNHIHYSVAIGWFASYMLYALLFPSGVEPYQGRYQRWNRVALVILVIMLFTISARTGLVAFFLVAVFLVTYFAWCKSAWQSFAVLCVFGLSITAIAVLGLPSLRTRVEQSLSEFKDQDPNHKSLLMRLEANKAATYGISHRFWLGAGPQHTDSTLGADYVNISTPLWKENRVMIHNQALHAFYTLGILGVLTFLLSIFAPIWTRHRLKNPVVKVKKEYEQLPDEVRVVKVRIKKPSIMLWWVSLLFFIVALQFESLWERQAGMAIFISLWVLGLEEVHALNRKELADCVPATLPITDEAKRLDGTIEN